MKKSKESKRAIKLAPPVEKFSYCVGHPWPIGPSNLDGNHISIYAHHTEVRYGTMADAEGFRDYVDEQTGAENFIYKLVAVPRKKKKGNK